MSYDFAYFPDKLILLVFLKRHLGQNPKYIFFHDIIDFIIERAFLIARRRLVPPRIVLIRSIRAFAVFFIVGARVRLVRRDDVDEQSVLQKEAARQFLIAAARLEKTLAYRDIRITALIERASDDLRHHKAPIRLHSVSRFERLEGPFSQIVLMRRFNKLVKRPEDLAAQSSRFRDPWFGMVVSRGRDDFKTHLSIDFFCFVSYPLYS